eukprot:8551569-Heterocapsa_arctica.AAC.1
MMKTTMNPKTVLRSINRPRKERKTDNMVSTMPRGLNTLLRIWKIDFEIPTSNNTKPIDMTDTQANHSFFNGDQIIKRAMEKAKQIQAHKRN